MRRRKEWQPQTHAAAAQRRDRKCLVLQSGQGIAETSIVVEQLLACIRMEDGLAVPVNIPGQHEQAQQVKPDDAGKCIGAAVPGGNDAASTRAAALGKCLVMGAIRYCNIVEIRPRTHKPRGRHRMTDIRLVPREVIEREQCRKRFDACLFVDDIRVVRRPANKVVRGNLSCDYVLSSQECRIPITPFLRDHKQVDEQRDDVRCVRCGCVEDAAIMVPGAGEATIGCLIPQQLVHDFDDKWPPPGMRDAVLARSAVCLEDAVKAIRDDPKVALVAPPTDCARTRDVKPSPRDALRREAVPDEKFHELDCVDVGIRGHLVFPPDKERRSLHRLPDKAKLTAGVDRKAIRDTDAERQRRNAIYGGKVASKDIELLLLNFR